MRPILKHLTKPLQILGLTVSLGILSLLPGLTGCASTRHDDQGLREEIEDRGTSSRVTAALADDTQYKYGGIGVETHRGTVELRGFVNSRDQKNRAGDLASDVVGVKAVTNNIVVKESAN